MGTGLGPLSNEIPDKPQDFRDSCWLVHGTQSYFREHPDLEHSGASTAGIDEGGTVLATVQALCARWLRTQNVCVLAGAGASVCAGAPPGSELLPQVRGLLKGRRTEELLEGFLRLCDEKSRDTHHPVDVEDLLSHLCGVRRLLEPSHGSVLTPPRVENPVNASRFTALMPKPLDELLSDFEAAIAVLCGVSLPGDISADAEGQGYGKTWDQCPTGRAHREFIGKLLSRPVTLGRVKIATTNYDTLFEQAMEQLGVLYVDGFTGRLRPRFDTGAFAIDHYYPGEVAEGAVQRYDRVIHLYKIHGSVNWRRVTPEPSAPYGVVLDSSPLPSRDDVIAKADRLGQVFSDLGSEAPRRLDGRQVQGLAILPTCTKYGETLGMPFAHLFREFSNALRQPQTVLFLIGYRGWDEHINQIVVDALANPTFTVVIVDPAPSAWTKRLRQSDRCQRVYAFHGEWGYFQHFVRYALPDVEQLKTQLDVARTLRELNTNRGRSSEEETS